MGFPKAPRELKGKEAQVFWEKLRTFKVSPKNRRFYSDAEEYYLRNRPKPRKP